MTARGRRRSRAAGVRCRPAVGCPPRPFAIRLATEIIERALAGATVGEVLERSRATDFLAGHTLLGLLQRRILIPAPGDLSARPVQKPLLSASAAHS